MVLSFLRGSKFRQWLTRTDCPPALTRCKEVLDSINDKGADTTPDSEGFIWSSTSTELFKMTGHARLRSAPYIRHNGVGLRADPQATNEIGNSLVMVRDENGSPPFPVRISDIYVRDEGIYLAVNRLLPLSNQSLLHALDRFMDYPAAVYSASFVDMMEEVPLNCVVGHYAWWDLSEDISLVLNLDQVSAVISIPYQNASWTSWLVLIHSSLRTDTRTLHPRDDTVDTTSILRVSLLSCKATRLLTAEILIIALNRMLCNETQARPSNRAA